MHAIQLPDGTFMHEEVGGLFGVEGTPDMLASTGAEDDSTTESIERKSMGRTGQVERPLGRVGIVCSYTPENQVAEAASSAADLFPMDSSMPQQGEAHPYSREEIERGLSDTALHANNGHPNTTETSADRPSFYVPPELWDMPGAEGQAALKP